jgi:hypothetical protein
MLASASAAERCCKVTAAAAEAELMSRKAGRKCIVEAGLDQGFKKRM